MIPFFKIFSLVIRIFTRPMVNYTKKYHLGNTANTPLLLRKNFVWLGNYYHRLESWINRKFLKIETPDALFIKPLSDDVALEKGVEFFYEILVYSILLVLPLYEMYATQASTMKKTEDQEKRLQEIEENISFIRNEQETLAGRLNQSLDNLDTLVQNHMHTTMQVHQSMELVRSDLIQYIDKVIAGNAVSDHLINPAGLLNAKSD